MRPSTGGGLDDRTGAFADIGRNVANIPRRWVPGANMWWARAAWNRGVIDRLQRIIDPEAEEDFARRSKRMKRENGQGQWWGYGGAGRVGVNLKA